MKINGSYVAVLAGALITMMVARLAESCSGLFDIYDICDQSYGTALEVYVRMSLLGCASKCLVHAECNSATFDPVNRLCNLNMGKAVGNLTDCANSLKYISIKQKFCKLYGNCSDDGECATANSACYNGVCACVIGYSYSPGDGSCVEYCDTFSETFTCASDRLLTASFITEDIDIEACKASCIALPMITCNSINFKALCYLANSPPVEMISPNSGFLYCKRNCN